MALSCLALKDNEILDQMSSALEIPNFGKKKEVLNFSRIWSVFCKIKIYLYIYVEHKLPLLDPKSYLFHISSTKISVFIR
jgi:hypothetical protein